MNKLTLSKKPENALPEHVMLSGERVLVHAGFRTVLKILRLLDDPELEDRHKGAKLIQLFYAQPIQQAQVKEAIEAFFAFIRPPERKADPEGAKIDYEFDADAIYASFLMQYRIDLLSTHACLHWYAFAALLGGLMEDTPLVERLSLRKLDTRKLKGKAKRSAEIAKRNAQPPVKVRKADESQQTALTDALMNGGDANALLGHEVR